MDGGKGGKEEEGRRKGKGRERGREVSKVSK